MKANSRVKAATSALHWPSSSVVFEAISAIKTASEHDALAVMPKVLSARVASPVKIDDRGNSKSALLA
jgi:hypothetical protein